MENGGVELIGVMPLENRGLKERLIRAIFGPSIVPLIDLGVMEFMALGFELIPLNPGMQDIQTPGSLIFKAVQKKWYKALYRALKESPTAPKFAVAAGSERSHIARAVGAP